MNKPPPIKVGDYVKVIKSDLTIFPKEFIGTIRQVESVSDGMEKGDDIFVGPNALLRWTDGEWEPVNFSIYLEQIEQL